ncbi:activator of HSP90 ATPase [Knoellia sinensis KCTC 19936]|uniref:Activator of HSP90 ATPase n=1 Tax=Knoellia sinensis KCTC 19936 TaxID=1385520 RepID=A0A0A0J0F4_9MICO|nr:SRPBCC domain-containing protein [Knoellia sinensis]KGN30518.1 activator of HSP90 ATPase [Knoellia sinensis KCTC 19936]
MVDILHQVGVRATPDKVFDALTTIDGLSGWWTEDTTGSTDVGGVIQFRFPSGGFDMRVLESVPGERVVWEVVGGPEEWIGTTIDWVMFQDDKVGDWTVVNFGHRGWKEPIPFMHHCSTKWATFLLSLKELIEHGAGSPSPRDLKIIFWELEAAAR